MGKFSTGMMIPEEKIRDFCKRWKITEFSLFGSVLRDDFRPDSDVDILVTFELNAPWGLGHLVDMRDELAEIFHRDVDLIERAALKNPFRREHILNHMRVIYAA